MVDAITPSSPATVVAERSSVVAQGADQRTCGTKRKCSCADLNGIGQVGTETLSH
jgi:hypothetical protein